jgi:hypothetical protein
MVAESLVDGRKGSVGKEVVKLDSFHLSANRASRLMVICLSIDFLP